jgi:hypothetical protein
MSVTVDSTFGPLWTWSLDARHTQPAVPAQASAALLPRESDDGGGASTFVRTFTLPVPLRAAIVDLDADARRVVDRITVRPAHGLGAAERLSGSPAVDIARYGHAIVFLLEGDAFMEDGGIWVAGGRSATFAIVREAPESRAPLRVFVRTPPVANQVTLSTPAWKQALTLDAGGERLVDVPIEPGALGVSLRVAAARGATPTQYERGSTDTRFLGCWIEVR